MWRSAAQRISRTYCNRLPTFPTHKHTHAFLPNPSLSASLELCCCSLSPKPAVPRYPEARTATRACSTRPYTETSRLVQVHMYILPCHSQYRADVLQASCMLCTNSYPLSFPCSCPQVHRAALALNVLTLLSFLLLYVVEYVREECLIDYLDTNPECTATGADVIARMQKGMPSTAIRGKYLYKYCVSVCQ